MRIKNLLLPMTVVLCVCLTAGMVAGCTGGPPTGPVDPGLKKGWLGGMEVIGYLVGPDSEGGALTVYDIPPSTSSVVQPNPLATLKAGSVDEAGIAALVGRYIWAAGRGSSGDVPEIRVDGIQPVEEQP